jgi:hypothetical protein
MPSTMTTAVSAANPSAVSNGHTSTVDPPCPVPTHRAVVQWRCSAEQLRRRRRLWRSIPSFRRKRSACGRVVAVRPVTPSRPGGNIDHNHVLHELALIISGRSENIPHIPWEQRLTANTSVPPVTESCTWTSHSVSGQDRLSRSHPTVKRPSRSCVSTGATRHGLRGLRLNGRGPQLEGLTGVAVRSDASVDTAPASLVPSRRHSPTSAPTRRKRRLVADVGAKVAAAVVMQ